VPFDRAESRRWLAIRNQGSNLIIQRLSGELKVADQALLACSVGKQSLIVLQPDRHQELHLTSKLA
jgi:hypothetical protein